MKVVVVGLGIQGKKRLAIAGSDAVATVDPVQSQAQYKAIESVPLENYDAALVCTPDGAKLPILRYLLSNVRLDGTPLADWKLQIASATTNVPETK